jgi:hypothetical protein
MTIFYQQSGTRGEQDFSKTLTSRDRGSLRFFTPDSIEQEYKFRAPTDATQSLIIPDRGVQIWGVPSGAAGVVQKMAVGDLVLLIGHLSPKNVEFGRFFYGGRITYILPYEDFDFSRRLWGDGGFPLIFFMQGALIDYTWLQFCEDFRFKPTYFIAGHIVRVPPERLAKSVYRTQSALAERLRIQDEGLRETYGSG